MILNEKIIETYKQVPFNILHIIENILFNQILLLNRITFKMSATKWLKIIKHLNLWRNLQEVENNFSIAQNSRYAHIKPTVRSIKPQNERWIFRFTSIYFITMMKRGCFLCSFISLFFFFFRRFPMCSYQCFSFTDMIAIIIVLIHFYVVCDTKYSE